MKVIRRSGLATLAVASVVALASCSSDSSGPSGSGSINDPQGLQTDVNGPVGTLSAGPLIGVGNIGNFGGSALDQLSRGHGAGDAGDPRRPTHDRPLRPRVLQGSAARGGSPPHPSDWRRWPHRDDG